MMQILTKIKLNINLFLKGFALAFLLLLSSHQIFSQPPVVTIETINDTLQLKSGSCITIENQSVIVTLKIRFNTNTNWRYQIEGNSKSWSHWATHHQPIIELKKSNYTLFIEEENGQIYSIPFTIKNSFPYYYYLIIICVIIMVSFILKILVSNFKTKVLKKIKNQVRIELDREYKLKLLNANSPNVNISKTNNSQIHKTFTKKHEQVSVLFADIQGFTKIVEIINPEELIDELDKFFFFFDEVAEKYDIEKIKTIGDAYMCAGGIPESNRTNPIEIVLAALEMQAFMKQNSAKYTSEEKTEVWELRIGIHTGSVISGMVGRKKIAFDIWGDTVNIASRMESSGKAGEVNITGITYQYIRDFFNCQYRGKMPIKYKGETDMYFVSGIKPELSIDGKGLVPNSIFFTRLQQIRFGDLEEFILNRLRIELPANFTYHNAEHTIDVITQIEIIARGENVSEKELLLLKTAALLHDTGFLFHFENHEENSSLIAREILPKYKYSQNQIDTIINLIKVTRIDEQPQNHLDEIMKDADLDYLGRSDYILLSENLFNELNSMGKPLSISSWNKKQFNFISNHKYYTKTAQNLRQVKKEIQLEKLKALMLV